MDTTSLRAQLTSLRGPSGPLLTLISTEKSGNIRACTSSTTRRPLTLRSSSRQASILVIDDPRPTLSLTLNVGEAIIFILLSAFDCAHTVHTVDPTRVSKIICSRFSSPPPTKVGFGPEVSKNNRWGRPSDGHRRATTAASYTQARNCIR